MGPILIAHTQAESFRPALTERFPRLSFAFASDADTILRALAEHQPEVVFSIKQVALPAPAHRPFVETSSVKWIQVGGSGFDHLEPWDHERLTVTHAAGVLSPFLAETVVGALFVLNHHFLRYHDQQRQSIWREHLFKPLSRQTLLVVGLGAIGSEVAQRAKALGMRVLAIRGNATPHPAVNDLGPPDRLLEFVSQADFVSLHVRANESTKHLVDEPFLAAMRPSAYLLNSSRGAVVNETALINALANGQLAGAYLDVFEQEPLPPDSPLWRFPNVLITPHCSDMIIDWPKEHLEFFMDNLARYSSGQPLLKQVVSS